MTDTLRDRLRITVSGSGPRTIVLGNGFGTTQAAWQHLLPWLEAQARVVRFDWPIDPGHFDHHRYSSLDAYATDLLAVIAETSAAPCILIGHSMSGMIGMLAGQARPDVFETIIMVNPSPRYINDETYHGGFSQDDVSALIKAVSDNYLAWVDNFAPAIVGSEAGSPEAQEFADGLLGMRPDVAMSMAVTLFQSDLRDRLLGFDVPTTIIQSTDDPAVPVEVAHYLHRHWPNSQVVTIEATGHLPHLTSVPRLKEALAPLLT